MPIYCIQWIFDEANEKKTTNQPFWSCQLVDVGCFSFALVPLPLASEPPNELFSFVCTLCFPQAPGRTVCSGIMNIVEKSFSIFQQLFFLCFFFVFLFAVWFSLASFTFAVSGSVHTYTASMAHALLLSLVSDITLDVVVLDDIVVDVFCTVNRFTFFW